MSVSSWLDRFSAGGAPRPVQARPAEEPAALTPAALMKDVAAFALQFPDRKYQTPRGREAGDFLATMFREVGLQPVRGSFFQEIPLPPPRAKDEVIVQRGKAPPPKDPGPPPVPGRNVLGLLPGTDPRLKDEVVIVAAHIDSQANTHQGANDNATGISGVLAIAKMLAANPTKRSVLFVCFDGEEVGRKGSRYYADHPLFPISKTALMVNMDMIGQVHLESGKRSEIYQWASADPFAGDVLRTASEKTIRKGETAIAGYPEQPFENQFFTTDVEPLYRLGVPTVNFLSGRDLDNHSPDDGMHRVIPERLAQYVRLAHQVAVDGANHPRPVADVIGLSPGGLMPSFPLISVRKEAANRSVHEERHRVSQIEARLPRLRALSEELLARLDDGRARAAGMTLEQLRGDAPDVLTEVALNRVRERHAELTEAYHEIPKGDLDARRTAADRLTALSGIEGVLAGALFLTKIRGRANDYQLKRVPEKLRELDDGARKLGLGHLLAGVIDRDDLADFTAVVPPDRAMEIAYENVSPLVGAISAAVYAMIDPQAAADRERRVDAKDLDRLRFEAGGQHGEARARTEQLLRAGEMAVALEGLVDYRGLAKGVTIAKVAEKIGALSTEIAKLPGTEAVTKELTFWKDWLGAFEKVEPEALAQTAARQKAVMVGWNALMDLWREVKPKITARVVLKPEQLEFPAAARRELYYRTLDAKKTEAGRDPVAEACERIALPLALAEDELRRLYRGSSEEAMRAIPKLFDDLDNTYPAYAARFAECLRELKKLVSKQEVQIGYGKGNTPVGVVDVRAAFKD